MDAGQILHVARESVEGFGHEDFENSVPGGVHKLEQTFSTEDRSTGSGFVLVGGDDGEIVLLRMLPAEGDLIFDRSLILQIGGKPHIYRGAFRYGMRSRLGRKLIKL